MMTTSLVAVQPGIYPNLPMAEYHAIDAASNHRLSELRRSPAHLRCYLDQPQEDTRALLVGRAAHTAILEPDLFDMTFAVAQQCDAIKKDGQRCSNSGILFRGELGWLCGVHGKGLTSDETRLVLPGADHTACHGMRDAVYAHRSARQLLTGPGSVELSVVWQHEESGVLCKGRYDRHTPMFAGGAIVDLKTCRSASKRDFEKSIFTLGYFRQASMYMMAARALGLPAEHFVFVAVEKDAPWGVAVYRVTEPVLEAGEREVRVLLDRYAECQERDEWPCYAPDVQDVSLPNWAWGESEEWTREAEEVLA